MICTEYEIKYCFKPISGVPLQKMDTFNHKTFRFFQRLLNFQSHKSVRSCKQLSQYYSSFSTQLRKTAFFRCSDRQHNTNLNNAREAFSSQNLIWEEAGQILIRSPHKDVVVPQVSFAEYMFSKLDEFKQLECMVSQNCKYYCTPYM